MKKIALILLFITITACTNKPQYPPNDFGNFPSMNYQEAIQKFASSPKSTLIFFNSLACVNCRKMEQMLLQKVGLQELKEKYNFINLYVDDQEKLPPNQWKEYRGKTRKTKGQVNATLQIELIQTGSQPYLVIVQDTVQKIIPYTPNYKMLLKKLSNN